MIQQTQKTTSFHPVVLDESGKLRKRFNTIHKNTRIEKQALASKIFEIGLDAIERGCSAMSSASER